MAATLPIVSPVAWPPNLRSLRGTLLPDTISANDIHLYFYGKIHPAWNDAQLAAVRIAHGDNFKTWNLQTVVRWIKRRPREEWLYYVPLNVVTAYMQLPEVSADAVNPPAIPPEGAGDLQLGDYIPRKDGTRVYLQSELPESDADARRIQLRRGRKLHPGQNSLQCRQCILNNTKPHLCSRSNVPVGQTATGPPQTPATEACDRCSRYGLVCMDLEGRVLGPKPEQIGTGDVLQQVRSWQCVRCYERGLNCDRSHPCRECRSAIPGAIAGRDCSYFTNSRGRGGVLLGAAVGVDDPDYYMGLGFGPWGIGTVRPLNRRDLPGPVEGDASDQQPHAMFDSMHFPATFNTRPEVMDHLNSSGEKFNRASFLTPDSIRAAMLKPLYAPAGRSIPLPSVASQGAQGVAAQFLIVDARQPDSPAFQVPTPGPVGENAPATPPYVDSPFTPPSNDPVFREVGDLAPDIFRFDDDDDGSGMMFGDDYILAQDPNAMDLSLEEFNFDPVAPPTPPSGDINPGLYGGGIDFTGWLSNTLVQRDNQLQLAHRPQAPSGVLALNKGKMGEIRPPTSPLPLSGPKFPGDTAVLPPFGQEAWSLDLFPATSLDEIAGLTIPTISIPLDNPDEFSGRTCSEMGPNLAECGQPAVARCVDRWHWVLNNDKSICATHDAQSKDLVERGFNHRQKMALRAYPCADCLHAMVDAGDVPYAATGTKIFGLDAPRPGMPDPPMARVNGINVGGSQGRSFRWETGCNCAKKLLQTYQCLVHRSIHADKLNEQGRRMQEWRINLSRDGSRTCYLCRKKPGVDHYEFQGYEGGMDCDYLFYMCMLCQGVVTAPPDPHGEPLLRRFNKFAVQLPISSPWIDNLPLGIDDDGDFILPGATAAPSDLT